MQEFNQQMTNRLDEMLQNAERPAIITHMKPDGDALGSSMGMYHFLRMSGKTGTVVLPHRPPATIDFLISAEDRQHIVIHEDAPTEAESAIAGSDLIICLDFNAFHRTDKLEKSLELSAAPKVLIDHHLNPDKDKFDLIFSETEVSSTSELLFHILMSMPQIGNDASHLPERTAESLMTGMITDTNNFGNSVFPSTLRMASALLAAGTDRDRILSNLYNRFSENRLRLLGHMLKDLLKITDDGVAYMILDRGSLRRYNVMEGDTEGFVNMPLSIDEVKMSILAKEDEDRIRISIRSKNGTAANRCARLHFNGGGHENAAGGRLTIPQDIEGISELPEYIESRTHTFMTEENEK